MPLLFYIVYGLWFLSEVILNRVLRSGKEDQQASGKHSLTYLWVTIMAAVIISANIGERTNFRLLRTGYLGYIGLAVLIAGMVFRFVAIASLGRFFTVDVAIRKDHTLKKDGLYKYIRHPSYTGSLLSFLGYGISLNNWLALVTVMVPVTAAFLYRIKVEEGMLVQQFGVAYEEYRKGTYRLIPGVY
jgi:protein-S-isoprenylcysteine O-methyltransferase Ste14